MALRLILRHSYLIWLPLLLLCKIYFFVIRILEGGGGEVVLGGVHLRSSPPCMNPFNVHLLSKWFSLFLTFRCIVSWMHWCQNQRMSQIHWAKMRSSLIALTSLLQPMTPLPSPWHVAHTCWPHTLAYRTSCAGCWTSFGSTTRLVSSEWTS